MKKFFSISLTLGLLMTAVTLIASPVSYAHGCGGGSHQNYHQNGNCPGYDSCPYYR